MRYWVETAVMLSAAVGLVSSLGAFLALTLSPSLVPTGALVGAVTAGAWVLRKRHLIGSYPVSMEASAEADQSIGLSMDELLGNEEPLEDRIKRELDSWRTISQELNVSRNNET